MIGQRTSSPWRVGHNPPPRPQPPLDPQRRHSGDGGAVDHLPVHVAWFDTGMPTGPAFGDPEDMTWGSLKAVLSQRREGGKDGTGFIGARFKPEPNGQVRRLGANLIARTLVVLDCEANKQTGQVPPPPDEAAARVRSVLWAGVVYTSHNHTAAAPRYRVVLPLALAIKPEVPVVEAVAERLDLAGVIDRSKVGAVSLFYCPSSEPGQLERHLTVSIDGAPIGTDWIVMTACKLLDERRAEEERIAAAARAEAEARRQAKIAAGYDPDDSLIEKIRAHLDLEQILLTNGYEKSGSNFRHPNSTSGQFGADIKVIGGIERVYSFNASDPLYRDNLPAWCGGVTAIDAVDVITILEFGADRTRALRELAERFGIIKPKRPREQDGKGNGAGPPPPPHPPGPDGGAEEEKPQESAKPGMEGLAEHLSAAAWLKRDLPPPDYLLGELLSTTCRVFLVGQTGLGKTNIGMAMAASMAAGIGFLHWICHRRACVLYIDGEMPAELLKSRSADALRRAGCGTSPPDGLFLFSRDQAEEVGKRWPMLGVLPALNTVEGQTFIRALCDALKPDLVVFDNVMALISGDQKDEVPWSETLPLITDLTRRRIGQLWIDHTGHNTERQYGSSTKAWRFDAVGIMTALPNDQRNASELAFTLSFDPPGKARRRTPENWHEFAPHIIRLADDIWTSETAKSDGYNAKVPPLAQRFHEALRDAIAVNSTRPGTTAMFAWEGECIRRDLIDPAEPDETASARHARHASWRKARTQLIAACWIGISGGQVTDLTQDRWI